MALGYTKEFILDAAISRYEETFKSEYDRTKFRDMIDKQYDEQGKDKFRTYACLDAEAIRKYRLDLKAKS